MPNRVAYVHATTLGYANSDKPEVVVTLSGPRGGNAGVKAFAPDEARRLAARIIDAANEVDPQP